jgi:hypothetical protein
LRLLHNIARKGSCYNDLESESFGGFLRITYGN